MDPRSIDPDCLPEVLDALALAHACELMESMTGLGKGCWRYRFKSEALETLGKFTQPQIEELINEQFGEKTLEIKTVSYSALFNTGNYSNERLALTAQIKPDEVPEEIMAALKSKVLAMAGPEAEQLYRSLRDKQRDLDNLEHKIRKATEEWNAIAEFLKAQGIKADAVKMPKFTNLLPSVSFEKQEIVEGEIENGDDDDD